MTQPSGNAAGTNRSPIVIEETGVATSYEATKNISCGDMEWRVDWKSGPARDKIRGGVTVVIAGKSKALPEAQAQIFDRLASVDSVSATCNKGANGGPTRSSLLVLGKDGAGKKALAQLNVDPDFKANWSFNIVE